ncbi:DEAD/DEAH box helicase family protein [Bradyrhizobium yuanmingense]|uniref:DEAD/DEAH box helicase family protein n=1 Tax=Bradyrhizobium yuanmingense TaxID=108015 RepID=UPI003D2EB54B
MDWSASRLGNPIYSLRSSNQRLPASVLEFEYKGLRAFKAVTQDGHRIAIVAEKSSSPWAGQRLARGQIGAVYATLAYWSTSEKPTTVVMPTGTGKTWTMLALLAAAPLDRLLVVVPNRNLRSQISAKFMELRCARAAASVARRGCRPSRSCAMDQRPSRRLMTSSCAPTSSSRRC